MKGVDVIRVRIRSAVYEGPVLRIPQPVSPPAVVDAVRGDGPPHVDVSGASPGPVHSHVGFIHDGMGLRHRTALARAGRTRGMETPYDGELATLREKRERLDEAIDGEQSSTAATHREQIAATDAEVSTLREAVASARGKLEVCRANDLETASAAEELRNTISELSERETEHHAARELLDRSQSNRRAKRDRLEERFRLTDRIANLERQARAFIVDDLHETYCEAFRRIAVLSPPKEPFESSPVDAAIAIASIADLSAPIVLVADRFEDPANARAVLEVPIIDI